MRAAVWCLLATPKVEEKKRIYWEEDASEKAEVQRTMQWRGDVSYCAHVGYHRIIKSFPHKIP